MLPRGSTVLRYRTALPVVVYGNRGSASLQVTRSASDTRRALFANGPASPGLGSGIGTYSTVVVEPVVLVHPRQVEHELQVQVYADPPAELQLQVEVQLDLFGQLTY